MDQEPPPVHNLQVGPRCKRCGAPLVGDATFYVYVRQMRRAISGQKLAETCLGCLSELLLDDPRFIAKLMSKMLNHPRLPGKLAEILLAELDKSKQHKEKPPGA